MRRNSQKYPCDGIGQKNVSCVHLSQCIFISCNFSSVVLLICEDSSRNLFHKQELAQKRKKINKVLDFINSSFFYKTLKTQNEGNTSDEVREKM